MAKKHDATLAVWVCPEEAVVGMGERLLLGSSVGEGAVGLASVRLCIRAWRSGKDHAVVNASVTH